MKWIVQVFLFVLQACSGAKIVAFSCSGTPSHKYVVEPLFDALVKDGHDVTVVTAFRSRSIPLYREIDIGMNFDELLDTYLTKRIQGDLIIPLEAMLDTFPKIMMETFEKTWSNPEFQQLLNTSVDLVILDSVLHEFALGFVHMWNAKLVYLANVPNIHHNFHALGHHFDYAQYSFMTTCKHPPFGFLDRLLQFVVGEVSREMRRYDVAKIERKLVELVPENIPPFLEIEKKRLNVILANFDTIISEPHPVPPNYIRLGAMTCRPPKPLPKNVDSFVARSGEQGFAIFSLGTGVVMSSMPRETRQAFTRVFSRYNLHVVWKWENVSTFEEDIPDNLYLSHWLPSLNDLLGHPKARLFMSHGGLIGLQEAIYHGVPIIGLPVFADQDNNVRRVERNGNGRLLLWKGLTEEKIDEAIRSVLYNPSFRQKAKMYSKMAKKPLTTWKQTALHYINMVIQNDNLDLFKVDNDHLNLLQKDLLDVYLFLIAFVFFTAYCLLICLRKLLKVRLIKLKED